MSSRNLLYFFLLHETRCSLIFHFVKLVHWFFSSWNRNCLWNLLLADFSFVWYTIYPDIFFVKHFARCFFIGETCCVQIYYSWNIMYHDFSLWNFLQVDFSPTSFFKFQQVKLVASCFFFFVKHDAGWVLLVKYNVCPFFFVKLLVGWFAFVKLVASCFFLREIWSLMIFTRETCWIWIISSRYLM